MSHTFTAADGQIHQVPNDYHDFMSDHEISEMIDAGMDPYDEKNRDLAKNGINPLDALQAHHEREDDRERDLRTLTN